MASHNHRNPYTTPPTNAAVSNSVMMAMMRSNAGASVAASSVNNGGHLMNQLQSRLGQILDEADHHRCSDGNKRALLAEKLENLRQLTKELEKDEWMYTSKKSRNSGTALKLPPQNKKRSDPPF